MVTHDNIHIPKESWPHWTWYAIEFFITLAIAVVIAFAKKSSNLKKICSSMAKGFSKANTDCKTIICKPTNGARVIKK